VADAILQLDIIAATHRGAPSSRFILSFPMKFASEKFSLFNSKK
jgi:hypothetical protein